MNARLHADRVTPGHRVPRRHAAALGSLPDGCYVLAEFGAALLGGGWLHPYTPDGYGRAIAIDPAAVLPVLTPRCTVEVLRAGYRPELHPSATHHPA